MNTTVMEFTKGKVEVSVEPFTTLVVSGGKSVAQVTIYKKDEAEIEANAELIAEAFNVANETGLTPRKLLAEKEKWEKALMSLTVGGSEYVNDPERCVWDINKFQGSQHQSLISFSEKNRQLKERGDELLEVLKKVQGHMTAHIPEKVFDLVQEAITKHTLK